MEMEGGESYNKLHKAFSSPELTKTLPGAPLEVICNKLITKTCSKAVSIAQSQAYNCADKILEAHDITNFAPAGTFSQSNFLLRERCIQKSRLGYFRCSLFLTEACEKTSIYAIKAIRLRMATIIKYLEMNHDVKVIWFVRDPRGILNSRIRADLLTQVSRKNAGLEAELLCKRMEADIKSFDSLSKQHSNRILTVRYEDIVTLPKETVKSVYSFLGLELTDNIKQWLEHTMKAESDDKGLFGTQRVNGNVTANSWRTQLKSQQIEWVSSRCKDVLNRFNYS